MDVSRSGGGGGGSDGGKHTSSSADVGSSSTDPLPGTLQVSCFPPTDSGVMRGWLTTHTPPAGQRLWFVLSQETLAYYDSLEAADAAEPLGMLGIDEMQSVKASKRTAKEFHLSITLSDERFARRLSHCASMMLAASAASASRCRCFFE